MNSLAGASLYESNRLLAEYLLFHYGGMYEILTYAGYPPNALEYPVRVVTKCLDAEALPSNARALDLGCAVGRSSFELARHCAEVVGIDFSHRFIEAAQVLHQRGEHDYMRVDEGNLRTPLIARVPSEIDTTRVHFEQGDAMDLRPDLGRFDVVLMANLIDRLASPRRCLLRLPDLVRHGGQLIITSPYTWLEEWTAPEEWLGGYERDGEKVTTLQGLQSALASTFTLQRTADLPFLIREHARKYQWSMAQASIWKRHDL